MTSWQHEVGQQVTLCLQLQSYLNAFSKHARQSWRNNTSMLPALERFSRLLYSITFECWGVNRLQCCFVHASFLLA